MKDNSKTIDSYIGHKIRDRRTKLHISQAELGEMLGVSAQQVQRYESGENGVALGKLPLLASTLNVKPNYFTDNLPVDEVIDNAVSGVIKRGLHRPLRILLVEDDTNDVLLFQTALSKTAHQATLHHLQKSDQVLDYLNRCNAGNVPDIMLLDINMPRITGIEVLRQVKTSPHKKIPIIMLTNSVRSKDMLACYEQHASGFIQKSADLKQFYDDVDRILSYWSGMVILPNGG
jgi:CheY-like chemotaxis protein/DNA-binding XRE family transcriptional regulator